MSVLKSHSFNEINVMVKVNYGPQWPVHWWEEIRKQTYAKDHMMYQEEVDYV